MANHREFESPLTMWLDVLNLLASARKEGCTLVIASRTVGFLQRFVISCLIPERVGMANHH